MNYDDQVKKKVLPGNDFPRCCWNQSKTFEYVCNSQFFFKGFWVDCYVKWLCCPHWVIWNKSNGKFMMYGSKQVMVVVKWFAIRKFSYLKVAIDGIIFENPYFPAIKQCSPFLMTLSTDPIFSGSVFSSSKTSIFAQKIDASMAMFEAKFSSSD